MAVPEPTAGDIPHDVPLHVGHNIHTVASLFAKTEQRVGRDQLAIERLMGVAGRPVTIYVIAGAIACWSVGNALAPYVGLARIDPPPFHGLAFASHMSALLMTLTILTTQNRFAKQAQQRAHLDLQVNLIAEEKIAKLISLVEELRRDLPSVEDRRDSLADAMAEAVDVQAMADELALRGSEGKALEGEIA